MPLWKLERRRPDRLTLLYVDHRHRIRHVCGEAPCDTSLVTFLRDYVLLHSDPFDVLALEDGVTVIALLPPRGRA